MASGTLLHFGGVFSLLLTQIALNFAEKVHDIL
jgi:hypothetical protein